MAKEEKNTKLKDSSKIIVKKGDSGAAVEDVQRKLNKLGYLKDRQIDSFYGDKTAEAVIKFSKDKGLKPVDEVTEKIWAKLVDASFKLGDRNLFLRIPYFHGNDVLELQKALGSLGFQVRHYDGNFGPSTEKALRRFQVNMGLPSDGIVGSKTFIALKNLQFTWSEKTPLKNRDFDVNATWRASQVLEDNSICLFGTDDFTRDVAIRMSNLARATNPFSKILCSNAYSIAPSKDTILLHIVLPDEKDVSGVCAPRVLYTENKENYENETEEEIVDMIGDANLADEEYAEAFVKRLINAISAAKLLSPPRMSIELPGRTWWDAGIDRSAQHYAITTLDGLCSALDNISRREND